MMNENLKFMIALLSVAVAGGIITRLLVKDTTGPISEIKKQHPDFKSKSYLWL